MRSTLEQMVRHASHFEETDLAARINADLASNTDGVTARLLFIMALDWIRARGMSGRASVMRLPDFPWSTKLKVFLQKYPELSELFQLRDDQLDFAQMLPEEDIRWAESYVVENYRPVACAEWVVRPYRP